jgi:diacylglycerol diphosphate phosphatase/phosphatidate phosphatase
VKQQIEMGLFSRHAREGPVPPTAATTTTTNTGRGFFGRRANDTHDTHERKHPLVLSMNQRPPFGQWLKATWLDIVTMAAMGIIGLGVSTPNPLTRQISI